MGNKISIGELAAHLTTPYSHLELGQVNDHAAYVMNFKESFPFHRHILDQVFGQVRFRYRSQDWLINHGLCICC